MSKKNINKQEKIVKNKGKLKNTPIKDIAKRV